MHIFFVFVFFLIRRTHNSLENDDDKIHRNDIEKLLSLEKLINIFLHEQICKEKKKNAAAATATMNGVNRDDGRKKVE